MKILYRILTVFSPSKTGVNYSGSYSYSSLHVKYHDLILSNGWAYTQLENNSYTSGMYQTPGKPHHSQCRILFTGGIHGDEPAGTLALLKLVSEVKPDSISAHISIIPCVNIWGLENGKRRNSQNLDINRCFLGKGPDELVFYKKLLRNQKFHFYFDCHEDWRFKANYIYNAFYFVSSLKNEVLQMMLKYGKLEKRSFGVLPASAAVNLGRAGCFLISFFPVGNSLYLLKNHVKSGMVLETGRLQPLEQRVDTAYRVISWFFKSVKAVSVQKAEWSDLIFVFFQSLIERLDIFGITANDTLIARFGSKRIGFIRIKIKSDFLELGNMYVLKKWRGMGVFSFLLEEALNMVSELKNPERSVSEVKPDDAEDTTRTRKVSEVERVDLKVPETKMVLEGKTVPEVNKRKKAKKTPGVAEYDKKLYVISRKSIHSLLLHFGFEVCTDVPQNLARRFKIAKIIGFFLKNDYELLCRNISPTQIVTVPEKKL